MFSGGPIDSSSSFRKDGEGEVTFNSPVAFAGTASVVAGAVWVNSTFSTSGMPFRGMSGGGYSVGGNGTITGGMTTGRATILPGGKAKLGTFAIDSIEFRHNSASLTFDVSAAGSDRLLITNPDGLTLDKTLFLVKDLGDAGPGTYPLLEYAGAPLANADWVVLGTPAVAGCRASIVNNPANRSIDVVLTPGSRWKTDADGFWQSSSNWTAGVPNAPGCPRHLGLSSLRLARFARLPMSASARFDSTVHHRIR